MAGGGGGRSLEQTPTWAVAVVCFALVAISIFIEYIIHLIGKWLTKRHKRALYESLEKIKSVGQDPISDICIPPEVGATWHPSSKQLEEKKYPSSEKLGDDNRRKLLMADDGARRILAAYGGKVPLVSSDGIHQLHIFIFVLAVFHVVYCILTMALGRAKMRSWKAWEKETRTAEYQFSHDPERFRFARETSFGRRHLSFWSKTPVLIWIVCFFRQFVRSVPKVDYLTLRHGFIMAHLAPQSHSNFDFQKYINRSLEEDFKVVVGISPPIWFFAVVFLLFNTHGEMRFNWLSLPGLGYVTLPLYALVTQMGSNMKPTIFNERVAAALRNWHHTAKKHVKQSKHSAPATPMSSRPATPSHGMSPVHLLRHYRSEMDSLQTSPRKSNFDVDHNYDTDSPSPTRFHGQGDAFRHHIELRQIDHEVELHHEPSPSQVAPVTRDQHEINIRGGPNDFSFDKRGGM
ncbi:hypothetical protein DH2020_021268 [Rehmannia glutinosa]|uniref:MLO-like protein n=1 Tax=Rehmannia glutinosa TaxID=99300 RepID=A0ABR0WAH3_REHGL